MFYLEEKYKYNTVYHDMIGISLINSLRNREDFYPPHEWFFMELFIKELIYKDPILPFYFVKFVRQFYPDYKWTLPLLHEGYTSQVVTECSFYSLQYRYVYDYFDGVNVSVSPEILQNASKLGEMVTNFLIRFLDFSLINFSNQDIILTSSNVCHKRFTDLLMDGYTIFKLAKIYFYIDSGMFYKLPVFPTRDIGVHFDEIIETSEGSYERILRFKD